MTLASRILRKAASARGYACAKGSFRGNVCRATRGGGDFVLKLLFPSQRRGYLTERRVYRKLPGWWPVKLEEAFELEGNHVIVTTNFPSVDWDSANVGAGAKAGAAEIVRDIRRQLDWLHANGIRHDDLLLKNVLAGRNGRAAVIDFEKSRFVKSAASGVAAPSDVMSLVGDVASRKAPSRLVKAVARALIDRFFEYPGAGRVVRGLRARYPGYLESVAASGVVPARSAERLLALE